MLCLGLFRNFLICDLLLHPDVIGLLRVVGDVRSVEDIDSDEGYLEKGYKTSNIGIG